MDSKKSGLLFLTITMNFIAIELVLAFTPLREALNETALMVISELAFMVPVFIFIIYSREPVADVFAVKGVKISTLLTAIPYTWTVTPLILVINFLSLQFTENRSIEIMDSLWGVGFLKVVLFSSVIAPICEELTFRGIIFTGLRKNGSALQAMLISAMLFGLFHMNINQALFAFVLGFFFAALREVTGSVLPSIVCHMTVNGGSTLMMYLGRDVYTDPEAMASSQEMSTDLNTMAPVFAVLIIAAFIGVALALCLLALISKKQNAVDRLRGIIDNAKNGRGKVWGIPLIAGMVLSVIFIIVDLILEKGA